MWELKHCNVWVNHLKINYKISAKSSDTCINKWTGELFCPLRVTVHRAAYWKILAICYQPQLCSLQNLRWTVQHDHSLIHVIMIIEFDTCMRHVWLKGKVTRSEKTCICVSDRYKFSPCSSQATHLPIGFQLDLSTAMLFQGVKFLKEVN